MRVPWRWSPVTIGVAVLVVVATLAVTTALVLQGRSPDSAEAIATVVPSPSPTPTSSPSPTASPSPTESPSPAPSPTPAASTPAPPVAADSPSPQPPAPLPTEVRAVWVHLFDDTLKTRAGIRGMVNDAAAANANLLIVEVVRRQDAYYASKVLPRTTDPKVEAGLDTLAYVLEQAHGRGIAVQAWAPVLPTYHHAYDQFDPPPGWVWTEHGPTAPESERWVTRRRDGTWSDYLDPALPEVVDHAAAIFAELARQPVDGVHLDYARYAGEDHGYHPRALQRFRDETGRTGTPAPTDEQWSDWRRAQVTNLVAQVRAAVKAVNPNVPVTAAVIAQGEGPSALGGFRRTRGFAGYFQDWESWATDGLLDMAIPMIYFSAQTHGDWFADWVDWSGQLAARSQALVVGGQGSWLNTLDDSVRQLSSQRALLGGVSVYSLQQNQSTEPYDRLLEQLPRGLWREPARLPPTFAPNVP